MIWLLWVTGNAGAGILGGAALDRFGTLGLVTLATLHGTAQWLVLRRYRPISPAWIPTTIIGSLVGLGVGAVVGWNAGLLGVIILEAVGLDVLANDYTGPRVPLEIVILVMGGGSAGLTMGCILGLSQHYLLKQYANTRLEWLAASSGGTALATTVAGLDLFSRWFQHFVTESSPTSYVRYDGYLFPSGAVSGLAFGLLYGAITGITLVRLLRQPIEDHAPPG